ncbi:LEM domain-containing protein 1 isoform X2 [Ascaphus truei]|uniref:LEM domain-containing protein 1 isoform X2 n=1 Tax=Ascaphus truei TaxID=8439 RepID=UPI003F5A012E
MVCPHEEGAGLSRRARRRLVFESCEGVETVTPGARARKPPTPPEYRLRGRRIPERTGEEVLSLEVEEETREGMMDVRSLSNSELKEQLLKRGVRPGPILPSTRSVYERKLQQLLEEGPAQVRENGAGDVDQYSDSEDEGFHLQKRVEMKSESPLRAAMNGVSSYSAANIPSSLAAEYNQNLATLGDDFSVSKILKQMERRSSAGQASGYHTGQDGATKEKVTADKNTMTYRTPSNTPKACVFVKQSRLQPEDPTRLDDFSEPMSLSPLGLSATRRKPIKGAAGRPIQFKYDDLATRARMQEQKGAAAEKGARRLVPVALQIVVFVVVAFFALVFLTMETNPENPFLPPAESAPDVQQP